MRLKRVNNNSAIDMRVKECFDYLKIYKSDLTQAQYDLVESLRKCYKTRGLSQRQADVLFNIAKYLKPEKELIVRKNY